jgi:hypothetical protein
MLTWVACHVCNQTGKEIIECKLNYGKIEYLFQYFDTSCLNFQNNKYGFIDKNGNTIVPAEYANPVDALEKLTEIKLIK